MGGTLEDRESDRQEETQQRQDNRAVSASPAPSASPVIIDTDPGIDDVVTLALAVRSPELRLRAVTTCYGNSTLTNTTRNASLVLGLAGGAEVPVLPGADRPMRRPLVSPPGTHGDSGVGYADVSKDQRARPSADRMVEPNPTVLLDVLKFVDPADSAILLTLGPLTNLAHALLADPDLVYRTVKRHIGMFGNLYQRGNTSRWADFNAWCDPEAVEVVLDSDLATEMVGLDVTRQMTLSAAEVAALARSPDGLVRWLADALRFCVDFPRDREQPHGCVVNDVLTLGEVLAPGLLDFTTRKLKIDRRDGEHRGRTVEHHDGCEVRVAAGVDITRMRLLLDRAFGSARYS